jgi:hypothetical protein
VAKPPQSATLGVRLGVCSRRLVANWRNYGPLHIVFDGRPNHQALAGRAAHMLGRAILLRLRFGPESLGLRSASASNSSHEMTETASPPRLTLDQQRAEFARGPLLAMPIAGAIAWTAIGIAGALLPIPLAAWALFIGTGMIFYLGLGVARLTGEDLLGKTRKNNTFDRLFLLTVLMACLVYAIAIPFFLIEPTSLPLTVGILTGLMWVPLSGMIQHWVGIFHGVTRTVAIVTAWYLFPRHRFVAIPAVIVVIYLATIYVLAGRRRETAA